MQASPALMYYYSLTRPGWWLDVTLALQIQVLYNRAEKKHQAVNTKARREETDKAN